MKTCGTCRHWEPIENSDHGICSYGPPSVIVGPKAPTSIMSPGPPVFGPMPCPLRLPSDWAACAQWKPQIHTGNGEPED